MKLTLKFGLHEPPKKAFWWDDITKFPILVLYKGKKWEFVAYDVDDSGETAFYCIFGEVQSYDPNWYATAYQDISHLLEIDEGCQCGASYTSFPNHHMFFCPKWSKR